jgi:hypothetical protein
VQQTVLVRLGGVPQPVGLHIRANIDPLLAVSPDSVDLGAIRPGALVAARVILHNTSGRPVQITAVEPSAPYVRARLTRAAQPQALEISLVNPPAGSLHERVTLRTSLGIRPRIDIPIQAQVRCKWALSDREFFFGFVNNGLRVSRTIEVSGLRRATVKRVWTTVTGASARVEPRLSRLGTTLAATLDLTRAQQGLLDGGVLVDTGDPQQPILNIPFVGVVSDPAENTTCCGQHSVQGPNASTARATPRSPSGETNAH